MVLNIVTWFESIKCQIKIEIYAKTDVPDVNMLEPYKIPPNILGECVRLFSTLEYLHTRIDNMKCRENIIIKRSYKICLTRFFAILVTIYSPLKAW